MFFANPASEFLVQQGSLNTEELQYICIIFLTFSYHPVLFSKSSVLIKFPCQLHHSSSSSLLRSKYSWLSQDKSSTHFKMASNKAHYCNFCHKKGHIESTCWKKDPGLKPTGNSRRARNRGSQRSRGGQNIQPPKTPDSLYTPNNGRRHGASLTTTEQDQQGPLFSLPDELLLNIAVLLCAPDGYGNTSLEPIKSFSSVSVRTRRVSEKFLTVTIGDRCPSMQKFGQLTASKGFLGQLK